MASEKKKWSLYNQKTEKQVDGLSFSQVQAIVASLYIKELVYWMAWHEGLTEWKAIAKFAEFAKYFDVDFSKEETKIVKSISSSQVTKTATKTATKAATKTGAGTGSGAGNKKREITPMKVFELDDELEKSKLILMSESKLEIRSSSRYKLKFDIKLRVDGVTISCQTIDISIGGMCIDRRLPSGASASLIACTIERSGAKVELSCRVVPDPKLKGSTRLIIKKIDSPELLRSWLFESA